MRLLICAGIFPPEVGGPATYSELLAEELTKRGHGVRVITYTDRPPINGQATEGQGSVPIYRLIGITRSFFKPWHYYKYYRAVITHGKDVDVIYAQGPVSDGYPAYLANRKLKKPFAVKITGDYSWEQARVRGLTDKMIDQFQNLRYFPRKIKKMREVQTMVCEAANLIITPSEYLKKIVAGWGIEEDKIRVIYNAVEIPDNYLNSPFPSLPKRGVAGEFLIVSAGRDVPWKGFVALEATVKTFTNSIELVNKKIRLEILQNLPREEYFSKLKSADLFVLNSGYEGFPHSVLEAMACGVPVITTNVGGNAEILTPLSLPPHEGGIEGGSGANGILVEYNNKQQLKEAIMKLYQNPGLRRELIENGKKTAAKFSLEKMINQTEKEIASLRSQ